MDRTHPAFRQWAMVTRACLTLRRAGIRARHPTWSEARVERELRREVTARRTRTPHD